MANVAKFNIFLKETLVNHLYVNLKLYNFTQLYSHENLYIVWLLIAKWHNKKVNTKFNLNISQELSLQATCKCKSIRFKFHFLKAPIIKDPKRKVWIRYLQSDNFI